LHLIAAISGAAISSCVQIAGTALQSSPFASNAQAVRAVLFAMAGLSICCTSEGRDFSPAALGSLPPLSKRSTYDRCWKAKGKRYPTKPR
jgi:hypothetical protein